MIAAGQWSREVGRLAGVELPIVPLQHHYLMTDPMPEVESRTVELPVFRDPDNSFYARQEGGGLIIGPFERNPLTWALDGIPEGFHGRLLPPNLEQIEDCLVAAADDGVDAHGLEPVYGEGERPVAYVSSGGYGHAIERSIALAYLPVEHAAVGTQLTIGILGERRPAVVCEQPLLDPAGERLFS